MSYVSGINGFSFLLSNRYEGDAMLDSKKETGDEVRGIKTVSLRHFGRCQLGRAENSNKTRENRISIKTWRRESKFDWL